jgi:hypothetical protein
VYAASKAKSDREKKLGTDRNSAQDTTIVYLYEYSDEEDSFDKDGLVEDPPPTPPPTPPVEPDPEPEPVKEDKPPHYPREPPSIDALVNRYKSYNIMTLDKREHCCDALYIHEGKKIIRQCTLSKTTKNDNSSYCYTHNCAEQKAKRNNGTFLDWEFLDKMKDQIGNSSLKVGSKNGVDFHNVTVETVKDKSIDELMCDTFESSDSDTMEIVEGTRKLLNDYKANIVDIVQTHLVSHKSTTNTMEKIKEMFTNSKCDLGVAAATEQEMNIELTKVLGTSPIVKKVIEYTKPKDDVSPPKKPNQDGMFLKELQKWLIEYSNSNDEIIN